MANKATRKEKPEVRRCRCGKPLLPADVACSPACFRAQWITDHPSWVPLTKSGKLVAGQYEKIAWKRELLRECLERIEGNSAAPGKAA